MPFDARCWAIPKSTLMKHWGTADGIESQHGGRQRKDTAWLSVMPEKETRCGSGATEATWPMWHSP